MPYLFRQLLLFGAYSGVSIVLFLLLLLSKNWHQQRSKKLLAGILLSFLIIVLLYISVYLGTIGFQTFLLPLGIVLPYALGPLLYFYIQSIYQSDLPTGKYFYRQFIPFFIALGVFSLPVSFLFYNQPQYLAHHPFIALIPLSGVLFMGYYFYRCFKLLKHYRILVKHRYASLSTMDLHWVAIWVKGLLLFVFLDAFTGGLAAMYPPIAPLIYLNVFYLVGLIWYIGYFGLRQTQVFLPEVSIMHPPTSEISKSVSTVKVFKGEAEISQLKHKLHEVVFEQALYKEEDVSMHRVAEILGTTDKKLSELINKELHTNFYEYINRFRVQAFQERITNGDGKHLTLLAIAYESGFNSKATFNRIFKKQTGLTPSQFKKKVEESQ